MLRFTRALALALAFGIVSPIAASAQASGAPYVIFAILSLTGQQAFLGKEQAETLAAITTLVNSTGGIAGRPVKFAIQDDESNPQVGVQLANQAIAQKVAVIIGPSLTSVCGAVATVVSDGPVDYCLSPAIYPPSGSYVFSAMPSIEDSYAAALRYFRLRGWKKIGILIGTDASGQAADRTISDSLKSPENASLQVVAHEYFNPTDLSVAAQIARIKAAGPQVMIAHAAGTPVGTLLRGIADAGISVPIFTSAANLTYAQMNAYAGFLPQVLLFPGSPFFSPKSLDRGPVKNSVQRYIGAFERLQIQPDLGQASAWDATFLAIDALRKIGPSATSAQIRDYIANLQDWPGIFGSYNFVKKPQRGLNATDVMIVRWDAAAKTWVGVSKPGGNPL